RMFTGAPATETDQSPALAVPDQGDEETGRAPAPRVPVKQGMNRFTWDMRYPGARDFPGLIMWAGSTRGPQAPPGRYTVKRTAAGVTKTQEFQIRRNQAVTRVTDADLKEQFTLARQISEKLTQANEAVLRIRGLKSQIAERLLKT